MDDKVRETVVVLPVQLLCESAQVPHYAHEGDAGLDLSSTEDVIIQPFERCLIPTGLALGIPVGYAGYVLPRSGLAIRSGLSIVNAPGLIDSGYRGEIKVAAINLDPETSVEIKKGERIAQLVIAPIAHAQIVESESLDQSERSTGGFGSTGV
jgi:dUTP pyrophosphatase